MSTSVLNRINSFFVSINVCCRIRDSDGSENKVNLFNTCLYLLFFPANLKVRGSFISCRISVVNLGPSVFPLEKVKSPGELVLLPTSAPGLTQLSIFLVNYPLVSQYLDPLR